MDHVITDISEIKSRRFARAILSKYGNKIKPGVFSIRGSAALDRIFEEIKWCNLRGLLIKIEVFNFYCYRPCL